jgi:hypothetical protein
MPSKTDSSIFKFEVTQATSPTVETVTTVDELTQLFDKASIGGRRIRRTNKRRRTFRKKRSTKRRR